MRIDISYFKHNCAFEVDLALPYAVTTLAGLGVGQETANTRRTVYKWMIPGSKHIDDSDLFA